MSGLTPVTGSTGIDVDTEFYIEFCSMSGLELNYFNLLKPDGEIFGGAGTPNYDVTYDSYWARLVPRSSLTPGVTYTLEIDGRIDQAGTKKSIDPGSWTVTTAGIPSTEGIEPYSANGRYWQFESSPLLLVGGFEGAHNVFLYPDQPNLSGDLTAMLDEMVVAGGNYMRCVVDPGRSIRDGFPSPFTGTPGNYNLDFFTSGANSFWGKFTTFLDETAARKIIVEIEFWSPHDWEDSEWNVSPWNPSNNSNYTTSSSGLATSYSTYNDHPFGQTATADPDYNGAQSDVIRGYQEAYIEHLLSISLGYDNVLYCMSNETKANPEWGAHWIGVVNTEAAAAGKTVYSSDMFDDGFDIENSSSYDTMFADGTTYPYCNISQVSQTKNVGGAEGHWNDLAYTYTETSGSVRPINFTKVYGADTDPNPFEANRVGDIAGQNSYWMNIIGGCASTRFHRSDGGLGLSTTAKASMTAARMLETKVNLWEMAPDFTHSLLTDRRTFLDFESGQTNIYKNNFEDGWSGVNQDDVIFAGYCDPAGSTRQNPQTSDGFSPSNGQYTLTTAQSRIGQQSAKCISDGAYACWDDSDPTLFKARSQMVMGTTWDSAILTPGEEYWTGVSLFIPTSNDITQNPPSTIMCSYAASTGISIRSNNGNFELQDGDVLGPITKGVWADFVRRIQINSDNLGGSIEEWFNGVKKVSRSFVNPNKSLRVVMGAYYGRYGANYDGPDGPIESSLPFEVYIDNVKVCQVTGVSYANAPFTYGEAFLSYEAGQQYALYLTRGASVGLDLTAYGGSTFDVDWINIDTAQWGASTTQAGGGTPTITPPGSGAWVAAIVRQ